MKKQTQAKGITLIALVITIIVLLILAGVTIGALTGENGILKNAQKAAEETRAAALEEQRDLWLADIYLAETQGRTAKSMDELLQELLEKGLLSEEEINTIKSSENNEITIGSKTISFNTEYIPPEEIPEEPVVDEYAKVTDGSWNENKKVNTPKLENTGLTAIYFDENNNEVELTTQSTDEEWGKWYDYANNKWANAITKDSSGNITGYFVWIPRYAYKITSNLGTSTAGTIEVKFLKGTTDYDESNTKISKTYPTVTNNAMEDYVVHPSFTDGTENKWQNGEWDEEIEGFWVAKYEAGFQASTTNTSGTLINGTDEIKYSDKKYTLASYNNRYTTNALSQDMTSAGYADEYMSYPVFKPLTYSYNIMTVGDNYTISREIQNATTFYGLSNIDSHMPKSSEWGAVLYLTQSKYGRNGTEVTINSKNVNDETNHIYSVTGYAEERALGVDASSTGNMTGVFDLSGGAWERVALYLANGNYYLGACGGSFAYTTAEENPTTRSTKYATAYPYNSASDTAVDNYNYLKNNFWGKKYGNLLLETINFDADNNNLISWFNYPHTYSNTYMMFFVCGGGTTTADTSGMFSVSSSTALPEIIHTFRVVLIPN